MTEADKIFRNIVDVEALIRSPDSKGKLTALKRYHRTLCAQYRKATATDRAAESMKKNLAAQGVFYGGRKPRYEMLAFADADCTQQVDAEWHTDPDVAARRAREAFVNGAVEYATVRDHETGGYLVGYAR